MTAPKWLTSRNFLFCSIAVFFNVLTIDAFYLPKLVIRGGKQAWSDTNKRLDKYEKSARITQDQLRAFIADAKASLDDNYTDVHAQVETNTVILKQVSDFLVNLNANSFGGKDIQGTEVTGLFPQINSLLSTSKSSVLSMTADIHNLSTTTQESLKPLSIVLTDLSTLETTLDTQIKDNSPEVGKTFQALTTDLVTFNKLMNDPNIEKILVNSADGSYHLAESAKTLDMVMEPWRKKAKLIMVILERALGMVKLTYGL